MDGAAARQEGRHLHAQGVRSGAAGEYPQPRRLGADSLDAVELNIALEEQLGLSIADEDRPNMKTVGDIVRYLEALEGTKDNRI